MGMTIYKASAGSGKTFVLTASYMALLLRRPESYRNILAVTFTNKATAEMKTRVLSQLYGISHGFEASDQYLVKAKEIMAELQKFTDAELRERAGRAMNMILQDWGRFRVETIDSFFQTIIRNLGRELQIGAGLNLELDTDMVISEAVTGLLASLKDNPKLLDTVCGFIEEKIEDDAANWHLNRELESFAKQLFNEQFLIEGVALRRLMDKDPQAIHKYKKSLNDHKNLAVTPLKEKLKVCKESVRAAMDTIEGNFVPSSKTKTPWARYVEELLLAVGTPDFRKKTDNKTIDNCIDDVNSLFNAYTKRDYPNFASMAEKSVLPYLKEAKNLELELQSVEDSVNAATAYMNRLQLLMEIRSQIDHNNREQGRFLLADTNHLLTQLEEGDTSFVFEKTGNHIQHIMIDEFQDTSKLQWQNFRLLIRESLSQAKESLVVGDVKQAIYRWRSSDWLILQERVEGELSQGGSKPLVMSLRENRRSCENIINFNNAIFPKLIIWLKGYYLEKVDGCLDSVEKAKLDTLFSSYSDVCQEIVNGKSGGSVKVMVYRKGGDTVNSGATLSSEEKMCLSTVAEIKRLHEEGVSLSDMAILSRKQDTIEVLAAYLSRNCPEYEYVTGEALMLDKSVAVRIIINALYYMTSTVNQVALVELVWLWRKYVKGEEVSPEDLTPDRARAMLPEEFVSGIQRLLWLPIYEIMEEVSSIFGLDKLSGEADWLAALFDAASDFVSKGKSLEEFLEYYETKLYKTAIPSISTRGIKLMTIHKSKGLEFHTVIIPSCDWQYVNTTHENLIWATPSAAPFDQLPLLPVKSDNSLKNSEFRKDYINEFGLSLIDNLNLLYVAFTRAGCNLVIMAFNTEKGRVGNTLKNSLLEFMEEQGMEADAGGGEVTAESQGLPRPEILYETGAVMPSKSSGKTFATHSNPFEREQEKVMAPLSSFPLKAQFRQSRQSTLFVRELEGCGKQDLERVSRLERGQFMHTLFARIESVDSIDREVRRLLLQGELSSHAEVEQLSGLLHKEFSNPLVRSWFNGENKLYRENAILFSHNGVLLNRRPDRVMVSPSGETTVVDFKFGSESEEHFRQVEEYKDLLRLMGRTQVKGYLWYFANKIVEV